jgi:hypothetical protein
MECGYKPQSETMSVRMSAILDCLPVRFPPKAAYPIQDSSLLPITESHSQSFTYGEQNDEIFDNLHMDLFEIKFQKTLTSVRSCAHSIYEAFEVVSKV